MKINIGEKNDWTEWNNIKEIKKYFEAIVLSLKLS